MSSQETGSVEQRIEQLERANSLGLLTTGLKGLEKESLRIDRTGRISTTPHPRALGAALTHPHITTDYSEALIELVTPPFAEAAETLDFLNDLHQFVYRHIGDELLLSTSMPPRIDGEASIPIARYGSSNIGRMKHVYRQGLAHRYGRPMQAIAGVHFNYSVDEAFWPIYRDLLGAPQALGAFVSDRYFGMIRNVHRYGWLLLYLFGCSPALCKSFFAGREDDLASRFSELDSATWYRPYATTLRMSDIGYKNDSQSEVAICFDDLPAYVESLSRAIDTPFEPYQRIGVKVDGEYRQLNANLLQIENEYYSPIRPKQVTKSGEKPTLALQKRGVRYLELRSIDLNCFEPAGVSLAQLHFLELFMVFCLLTDSPLLAAEERAETSQNALAVACCGRTPDFGLMQHGQRRSLPDWATGILDGMESIARVLDGTLGMPRYLPTIAEARLAVEDSSRTPSAVQLEELRGSGRSFAAFAVAESQRHAEYFRTRALTSDRTMSLARLAEESLQRQRQIEAADRLSFDEFLTRYFGQS
ncbi:MAG: glutamate--cysteine ligase [Methylotetracoccus sp.]